MVHGADGLSMDMWRWMTMPKQMKSWLPREGKYVVVDGKRIFIPKEETCQKDGGK